MTLLPEVRDEIVATAARRAARRTPARVRPARGGLVLALSVASVVAVVAVALVALRHRAPVASEAGARNGLSALESKLAVLRRSQTAADRTYLAFTGRRGTVGSRGVIAGLSRLATTITTPAGGRVRAYLLVRNLPGQSPARRGPDYVSVVAFDPRGQLQGAVSTAVGAALAPNDVGSGRWVPGAGRESFAGVSVGIVPDGVTRVRWTFSGAGFGVLHPRASTVYPDVHGNVAIAPIRAGQGPLVGAVWYGAGGRVIASGGSAPQSEVEMRQINAVNASRNRPIASVLTAHYRLFRSVAPQDLVRDPRLPTVGGQGDLNYWQTRYIPTLTGIDGAGLWITPGEHDLCVSDPQAAACGMPKTIGSTGFIGATSSDGRQRSIAGLVPDGNPSVTLVLANGARTTVPVIDNAYEATVSAQIVAVLVRDTAGHVERVPLG